MGECDLNCSTCGLNCEEIDEERFANAITDNFKVAIAMENSMVANSITMETMFKQYELVDGKVINESILFPMESTVRATSLADYFAKMKINVIITGAISPTLKKQLEESGIKVISGVRGSDTFLIKQYLSGKIA